MKNVFWYDTSPKKKIIRVIIANLFMIPSWIFYAFFDEIMEKFNKSAVFINEYLFFSLHFFLLYYLLFGLSPYYVFAKMGLTNKTPLYSVIGDI